MNAKENTDGIQDDDHQPKAATALTLRSMSQSALHSSRDEVGESSFQSVAPSSSRSSPSPVAQLEQPPPQEEYRRLSTSLLALSTTSTTSISTTNAPTKETTGKNNNKKATSKTGRPLGIVVEHNGGGSPSPGSSPRNLLPRPVSASSPRPPSSSTTTTKPKPSSSTRPSSPTTLRGVATGEKTTRSPVSSPTTPRATISKNSKTGNKSSGHKNAKIKDVKGSPGTAADFDDLHSRRGSTASFSSSAHSRRVSAASAAPVASSEVGLKKGTATGNGEGLVQQTATSSSRTVSIRRKSSLTGIDRPQRSNSPVFAHTYSGQGRRRSVTVEEDVNDEDSGKVDDDERGDNKKERGGRGGKTTQSTRSPRRSLATTAIFAPPTIAKKTAAGGGRSSQSNDRHRRPSTAGSSRSARSTRSPSLDSHSPSMSIDRHSNVLRDQGTNQKIQLVDDKDGEEEEKRRMKKQQEEQLAFRKMLEKEEQKQKLQERVSRLERLLAARQALRETVIGDMAFEDPHIEKRRAEVIMEEEKQQLASRGGGGKGVKANTTGNTGSDGAISTTTTTSSTTATSSVQRPDTYARRLVASVRRAAREEAAAAVDSVLQPQKAELDLRGSTRASGVDGNSSIISQSNQQRTRRRSNSESSSFARASGSASGSLNASFSPANSTSTGVTPPLSARHSATRLRSNSTMTPRRVTTTNTSSAAATAATQSTQHTPLSESSDHGGSRLLSQQRQAQRFQYSKSRIAIFKASSLVRGDSDDENDRLSGSSTSSSASSDDRDSANQKAKRLTGSSTSDKNSKKKKERKQKKNKMSPGHSRSANNVVDILRSVEVPAMADRAEKSLVTTSSRSGRTAAAATSPAQHTTNDVIALCPGVVLRLPPAAAGGRNNVRTGSASASPAGNTDNMPAPGAISGPRLGSNLRLAATQKERAASPTSLISVSKARDDLDAFEESATFGATDNESSHASPRIQVSIALGEDRYVVASLSGTGSGHTSSSRQYNRNKGSPRGSTHHQEMDTVAGSTSMGNTKNPAALHRPLKTTTSRPLVALGAVGTRAGVHGNSGTDTLSDILGSPRRRFRSSDVPVGGFGRDGRGAGARHTAGGSSSLDALGGATDLTSATFDGELEKREILLLERLRRNKRGGGTLGGDGRLVSLSDLALKHHVYVRDNALGDHGGLGNFGELDVATLQKENDDDEEKEATSDRRKKKQQSSRSVSGADGGGGGYFFSPTSLLVRPEIQIQQQKTSAQTTTSAPTTAAGGGESTGETTSSPSNNNLIHLSKSGTEKTSTASPAAASPATTVVVEKKTLKNFEYFHNFEDDVEVIFDPQKDDFERNPATGLIRFGSRYERELTNKYHAAQTQLQYIKFLQQQQYRQQQQQQRGMKNQSGGTGGGRVGGVEGGELPPSGLARGGSMGSAGSGGGGGSSPPGGGAMAPLQRDASMSFASMSLRGGGMSVIGGSGTFPGGRAGGGGGGSPSFQSLTPTAAAAAMRMGGNVAPSSFSMVTNPNAQRISMSGSSPQQADLNISTNQQHSVAATSAKQINQIMQLYRELQAKQREDERVRLERNPGPFPANSGLTTGGVGDVSAMRDVNNSSPPSPSSVSRGGPPPPSALKSHAEIMQQYAAHCVLVDAALGDIRKDIQQETEMQRLKVSIFSKKNSPGYGLSEPISGVRTRLFFPDMKDAAKDRRNNLNQNIISAGSSIQNAPAHTTSAQNNTSGGNNDPLVRALMTETSASGAGGGGAADRGGFGAGGGPSQVFARSIGHVKAFGRGNGNNNNMNECPHSFSTPLSGGVSNSSSALHECRKIKKHLQRERQLLAARAETLLGGIERAFESEVLDEHRHIMAYLRMYVPTRYHNIQSVVRRLQHSFKFATLSPADHYGKYTGEILHPQPSAIQSTASPLSIVGTTEGGLQSLMGDGGPTASSGGGGGGGGRIACAVGVSLLYSPHSATTPVVVTRHHQPPQEVGGGESIRLHQQSISPALLPPPETTCTSSVPAMPASSRAFTSPVIDYICSRTFGGLFYGAERLFDQTIFSGGNLSDSAGQEVITPRILRDNLLLSGRLCGGGLVTRQKIKYVLMAIAPPREALLIRAVKRAQRRRAATARQLQQAQEQQRLSSASTSLRRAASASKEEDTNENSLSIIKRAPCHKKKANLFAHHDEDEWATSIRSSAPVPSLPTAVPASVLPVSAASDICAVQLPQEAFDEMWYAEVRTESVFSTSCSSCDVDDDDSLSDGDGPLTFFSSSSSSSSCCSQDGGKERREPTDGHNRRGILEKKHGMRKNSIQAAADPAESLRLFHKMQRRQRKGNSTVTTRGAAGGGNAKSFDPERYLSEYSKKGSTPKEQRRGSSSADPTDMHPRSALDRAGHNKTLNVAAYFNNKQRKRAQARIKRQNEENVLLTQKMRQHLSQASAKKTNKEQHDDEQQQQQQESSVRSASEEATTTTAGARSNATPTSPRRVRFQQHQPPVDHLQASPSSAARADSQNKKERKVRNKRDLNTNRSSKNNKKGRPIRLSQWLHTPFPTLAIKQHLQALMEAVGCHTSLVSTLLYELFQSNDHIDQRRQHYFNVMSTTATPEGAGGSNSVDGVWIPMEITDESLTKLINDLQAQIRQKQQEVDDERASDLFTQASSSSPLSSTVVDSSSFALLGSTQSFGDLGLRQENQQGDAMIKSAAQLALHFVEAHLQLVLSFRDNFHPIICQILQNHNPESPGTISTNGGGGGAAAGGAGALASETNFGFSQFFLRQSSISKGVSSLSETRSASTTKRSGTPIKNGGAAAAAARRRQSSSAAALSTAKHVQSSGSLFSLSRDEVWPPWPVPSEWNAAPHQKRELRGGFAPSFLQLQDAQFSQLQASRNNANNNSSTTAGATSAPATDAEQIEIAAAIKKRIKRPPTGNEIISLETQLYPLGSADHDGGAMRFHKAQQKFLTAVANFQRKQEKIVAAFVARERLNMQRQLERYWQQLQALQALPVAMPVSSSTRPTSTSSFSAPSIRSMPEILRMCDLLDTDNDDDDVQKDRSGSGAHTSIGGKDAEDPSSFDHPLLKLLPVGMRKSISEHPVLKREQELSEQTTSSMNPAFRQFSSNINGGGNDDDADDDDGPPPPRNQRFRSVEFCAEGSDDDDDGPHLRSKNNTGNIAFDRYEQVPHFRRHQHSTDKLLAGAVGGFVPARAAEVVGALFDPTQHDGMPDQWRDAAKHFSSSSASPSPAKATSSTSPPSSSSVSSPQSSPPMSTTTRILLQGRPLYYEVFVRLLQTSPVFAAFLFGPLLAVCPPLEPHMHRRSL